jgi:hypothetical protein
MKKAIAIIWLLAIAGCSTAPPKPYDADSPCELYGESSYECQVKRYHDVSA